MAIGGRDGYFHHSLADHKQAGAGIALGADAGPARNRFPHDAGGEAVDLLRAELAEKVVRLDRKSTRLNSSHANISYAVFCLKKKKTHVVGAHPLLLEAEPDIVEHGHIHPDRSLLEYVAARARAGSEYSTGPAFQHHAAVGTR